MGLSDSESTLDVVTESDRLRSSQHQMETTDENHENWGVFQSFIHGYNLVFQIKFRFNGERSLER